ncbi:ATP-binding protein [Methylotuvimicrobium buryatense]|uniref:ATP-binding protein n=1 Tax=Methylotuvimicrobium buryatense TaxID=95641 RepID=A0A4V1IJP7_METBY|nr:ATP-binding protein [Methylotuvimicrobium buryatense]QCW82145.1 ATP-binding protein [Methylotuvimicrobium buryatense]
MPRNNPVPVSVSARILIASPNQTFTETLKKNLVNQGYLVSIACEHKEALSLIAAQDLDLIVTAPLLDYRSGNIDDEPSISTLAPNISQAIFIVEPAGSKAMLSRCLKNPNQATDILLFDPEFIENQIARLLRHRLKQATKSPTELRACQWAIAMQFNIEGLRLMNPIPAIIDELTELHGLHGPREMIFTIVSELFTNALDHGLLRMDSLQKQTPEDFLHFYELRQERLNSAMSGKIEIAIDYLPKSDGGQFIVDVQDSGEGFNIDDIFSDLDNNQSFFGRGIQLVTQLCSTIEYNPCGNRVKAVYDWYHKQKDQDNLCS